MYITLITILFSLAACFNVIAQQVETTVEKGKDFKKYSTFRVDKGELIAVSDVKVDEENFYKNIKDAIVEELTGRGYTLAKDSTADLIISYIGKAIVAVDVQDLGPLGQEPATTPAEVDDSQTWTQEYREGSLVIDVTDARENERVYRASSDIDFVSLADIRTLNIVVAKSFRKLPKKRR